MEVSQPDVFAVVPSYNHGGFIEKCIRSIFHQTVAPKKLLVIDDGSTDGSPDIIASTLKDCPFDSELIVRENRGLCATLNQAYSLATGKYFAYLGADDLWLPTFFEERIKLMEANPTAVLGHGSVYFIDDDDGIIEWESPFQPPRTIFSAEKIRQLLLEQIEPISASVFYLRSALENVRWDESYRLEDYQMYIQLQELGDFAYDPQKLSAWRIHQNNTSKQFDMMLAEKLRTQTQFARELRLDADGLADAHQKTRFHFARVRLERLDKRGAFSIGRTSWRGAESLGQLLRFLIRLMIPNSVVALKRQMGARNPRKRLVLT